jgi:ParB-like chromosome segregation protein Spo0J
MKLKLKDIRLDGGTQPREYINQDVVNEYADEMLESDSFPPLVVFNDGANYWLADGFHRYHANKKAGFLDVECDVRNGTLREAVLFSVGANSVHGLRRTNEDKRKAVLTLLNDIEWGEWSDSEIARICCVTHVTVGRIRKAKGLERTEKKYIDKHGKENVMKQRTPSEPVILKPSEVMEQEDRITELATAHAELAEENARLLDRLAVQNMEGTEEEKQAVAETIEDLRTQLRNAEVEIRALKISREGFQAENVELKRQVKFWRGKCEKMEKVAA